MQISGGEYGRDDYFIQPAEVGAHNNSDEDDEQVSSQGNIGAGSRGRKP